MWVKDIRNYEVEIHQNGQIIFFGNVNDVSDELKETETKNITIEHKKLIVEI
jgi:hypothetical protein